MASHIRSLWVRRRRPILLVCAERASVTRVEYSAFGLLDAGSSVRPTGNQADRTAPTGGSSMTRQPDRLRFGAFEVDLRAGALSKRGLSLRLQQQPFQVLAMLLETPGEL